MYDYKEIYKVVISFPQKSVRDPPPPHTHCCDVPWMKFTSLQSLGDVYILPISEKILLALCYSKCLDRNAFCWFKHVYMYEYYIFDSWVQFSYRHRLKPCHEIDPLWFYALLLSISPHFFVDNLLENKCLFLKGLKNSIVLIVYLPKAFYNTWNWVKVEWHDAYSVNLQQLEK